jgi:hypothetical protein
MMVRTQTAFWSIDGTELESIIILITHKLLIRIGFRARLELDRCVDAYTVKILRCLVAHDGETPRKIDCGADGLSNCSELLITRR